VLCLPGLTVLVSIEAGRPEPWFPGPLDPFQAWFPGIGLSRDFERAKVRGNPMKIPFVLVSLGKILAITICARKQPNHVKQLLNGL
jgi:hypothetical protein